ncbi:hypothetical protein ABB37_01289 [Leptomonas pyrrhocoris]|uniref:Uncharacterized protein n=1 Tax=Leptomonas pyrrhocoris TaxID=157538 RepID=A0A0M9G8R4_LEPPY|nr:hypothetical protein ABB37_01289 [Leptomonas pyrrhocoris]KPA84809.1 hypothetical protein ABB37_01289 [Leptomonas pyrrhocoris]|eukprot:XP_015663248.1 hypothetical protein ABB37_01289 [Leptomonas pyrrhocoris]
MILGVQMMEMDVSAPRTTVTASHQSLGAPRMASTGNDDKWGDDDDNDGFEEVDMTPAPAYRALNAHGSPWGTVSVGGHGINSAVGASSVAGATHTPVSVSRDPRSAAKKKTPPNTPLAHRGSGGGPAVSVVATTPTPVRRPGGMSLRKKSPPVRSTPAGEGGSGGGVTPSMLGVRPGAASGMKPLHLSTVSSSPSSIAKPPGHQVKMDDDDKWDDDW